MWCITKVTFFFLIRCELEKEIVDFNQKDKRETSKTDAMLIRYLMLSDHKFFD